MQTSVIVGKFSQLVYTSVCARDRKRDREKEKASRGKGELVEYYEEGKKEGRIPAAELTKPAGTWYPLKDALKATYKILHLPTGAQVRNERKTPRHRCAARQMR